MMLPVSEDQLKEELGATIMCRRCKQEHDVRYGEMIKPDRTREPTKSLAYVQCGGRPFFCGMNGRRIYLDNGV